MLPFRVDSPREYYEQRIDSLSSRIRVHQTRNRLFVGGEIASFAFFIAFIFAYAQWGWGWIAIWLAVMSLVAYVAIRRLDEHNEQRTEWLEALRDVCIHEMASLDGDYTAFDDGKRYIDANHPFTMDMDVFGNQSLYQRICRATTTGGADRLAALLSSEPVDPDNITIINQRTDAITTLSRNAEWRTEFCAVGVSEPINTQAVARAMHDVNNVNVARWVMSPLAAAVAMAMSLGLVATIVLATIDAVPSSVAVLWALVQLGVVLGLCHGKLMEISRTVGKLQKQMTAYVKLVKIIATYDCNNDDTLLLQLVGATGGAVESFHEVEKILAGLDRRGNLLGLILADIFTLSDFRLLRRFAMWQRRYTLHTDRWIAAVSEMDALVSMATFAYNHPHGVRAQIVEGDDVVYEGQGIYHPFIGKNAVANDFNIKEHNYYIITGANMAGKSTFLRSLGVNWLLAMNGLPVFAHQLRISVFPLFTSMRTTDDLTRGISYFNAELLRLKSLIDFCATHTNTLIILDEILKGTNSADKLGGSRLFLEYISQRRVTGVIATHDLELSRLATEQPQRFHNYCFEIELGTNVTYTYKITPGVARNQNATFLLKELLK